MTLKRPDTTLPLRYRLPMPPALFVGRTAELLWLRTALTRAPAVLVSGAAGMGKTALVLRALRNDADIAARPCLFVRAPAGRADSLAVELAKAVAAAVGGAVPAGACPLTFAIESAETHQLTVLVDDLHRADIDAGRELLELVNAHCTRSTWLVISRTDPLCRDLASQTLALGPLLADELSGLAREVAPELSEDQAKQLADTAAGSPAALWHAVDHHLLANRAPDPRQLETLPPAAAAFLRALDAFEISVPVDVVLALTPTPHADALELLAERNFIQVNGAGYSLTDAARAAGASAARESYSDHALADAATSLAKRADADAWLEAVRLYRAAGQDKRARALIDRVGGALIASGRARRLHEVLAECEDDQSMRWKLHCAVTTGDPQALASAREPRGGNLHDRHRWACALRLRGQLVHAAAAAEALERDANDADDAELAFEAGLLRARSLAARGSDHTDESIALLLALRPPNEACAVRRDARLAVIESRTGDPDKALDMVDALRGRLHELPRRQRTEVVCWLASIIGRVGRIVDAERMLDRALADADAHDAATLNLLYLSSGLALKRAAYDRAEAIVNRLERLGEGTSTRLHRHVAILSGFRAVAKGDFAGIEHQLAEEAYGAAKDDLPVVYGRLAALTYYARTLMCSPPGVVAPADDTPLTGHPFGELLRLRRNARLGDMPSADQRPRPETYRNLEARIVAGVVRAEISVLHGAAAEALPVLKDTLATAQRYGYESWEFGVRQLICETLLIMNEPERAAAASRELSAVATRAKSPYHTLEALFFEMATASTAPQPGTLERLAEATDCAPVAGRRARLLLGGSARSDKLDELVLAALRKRRSWANVVPITANAERPDDAWISGWGLDEFREQVWLPAGRTVDFSRWPVLWALLRALAEHGDCATKEYLVRAVWNESEYHPLRHDNRLQAAVRKLRHAIEDDASKPQRVVTTSTGYRLGGTPRRMRQQLAL